VCRTKNKNGYVCRKCRYDESKNTVRYGSVTRLPASYQDDNLKKSRERLAEIRREEQRQRELKRQQEEKEREEQRQRELKRQQEEKEREEQRQRELKRQQEEKEREEQRQQEESNREQNTYWEDNEPQVEITYEDVLSDEEEEEFLRSIDESVLRDRKRWRRKKRRRRLAVMLLIAGGVIWKMTADYDGKVLVSEDGLQYQEHTGGAVITGYQGNDTVCVIPETIGDLMVTAVEEGAFQEMEGVRALHFPQSVEVIEADMWKGSSELVSVRLPESVTRIEQSNIEWTKSQSMMLFVEEDSYAYRFALRNELPYVITDSSGVFHLDEETGAVKYSGRMENIRFDSVFAEIDDEVVYIADGVASWQQSGLVDNHGLLCYVDDGKWISDHCGVESFDGRYYYVNHGVVDQEYTGEITYDGRSVQVKNGVIE